MVEHLQFFHMGRVRLTSDLNAERLFCKESVPQLCHPCVLRDSYHCSLLTLSPDQFWVPKFSRGNVKIPVKYHLCYTISTLCAWCPCLMLKCCWSWWTDAKEKWLNVINRPVGLVVGVGSAEDKLNQKKTMLECFRVNLGINCWNKSGTLTVIF